MHMADEVERRIVRAWLNDRYARLRAVEQRAADVRLTPVERQAAAGQARQLAREIIAAEQRLYAVPRPVASA